MKIYVGKANKFLKKNSQKMSEKEKNRLETIFFKNKFNPK
jgi:hypothetical protein